MSTGIVSQDPKPPYSSPNSSVVATFTTLKFWPSGLRAVCDHANSVKGNGASHDARRRWPRWSSITHSQKRSYEAVPRSAQRPPIYIAISKPMYTKTHSHRRTTGHDSQSHTHAHAHADAHADNTRTRPHTHMHRHGHTHARKLGTRSACDASSMHLPATAGKFRR